MVEEGKSPSPFKENVGVCMSYILLPSNYLSSPFKENVCVFVCLTFCCSLPSLHFIFDMYRQGGYNISRVALAMVSGIKLCIYGIRILCFHSMLHLLDLCLSHSCSPRDKVSSLQ